MKTRSANTSHPSGGDEKGIFPSGNKSLLDFADFQIEYELGVGTAGTIYRAEWRTTGDLVALKVLLPTVSLNSIVAQRFGREMLILEKLNHPHIVRYYGGGVVGKQLFYAMEFVDGGSLKELMERVGHLSWREVCSCGRQICSALQFAHNHGIIHRDLKPSNLFLTEAGQVKLGDFGIARDTHEADITSEGLTVGTYAYMSPEQIRGDRQITGQVDLYSLGCLLFEMSTGRAPYRGANFAQLFHQHLNSPVPRICDTVPDCPPELDEVVWQLMQKDAEARPFNARYVQGVLMDLSGVSPGPEDSGDVAADATVDPGQRELSRRLQALKDHDDSRNVSWWKIGLVLLLTVLAIVIAAQFTS